MKKAISITLSAIILVTVAMTCVSCGGPKLIGIVPAYTGADVTDTNHEFSNEDFFVIASYDDGTDETVTDFEFSVEGMNDGYYIILITYKDVENECFVPLNLAIYPSDNADSANGNN